MQKGDKVKLVKACPMLDEVMKISVGDIGVCANDPDEGFVDVIFGTKRCSYIMCTRLEQVDKQPISLTSAESSKFKELINVAYKEYNGMYTDEIDFFVEFLRKKIMEVSK